MPTPNKLPPSTYEETKARAQRILDQRGKPPYTRATDASASYEDPLPFTHLSEDELLVLSEFVQFWLPFLVEKKK